jgi:Uma2 family endonuclease
MSTAVLPTPATTASPKPRPYLVAAVEMMKVMGPGEAFLLNDVSWEEYRWFDAQRDQYRHTAKLVYSAGRLEIVTVSFVHDRSSRRLYDFILAVAMELKVPLIPGGGFTLDREDLEDGLQADECFYIQNIEVVRYLEEIDLAIHPPPDLAIEVDRTNSSIPKEPIYRRIGVPEVWRFEGGTLTFRIRQTDGSYLTQPNSRAFPPVTSAEASRLLISLAGLDSLSFIENIRNWVRTLVPQQP